MLVGSLIAVERKIFAPLLAISEAKVVAIANDVILQAVNSQIDALLEGKNLLDFHQDSDGHLLYVKTNTAGLNRLHSDALGLLQDALKDLEEVDIYVPFGQILGSTIFAAAGPKIKVVIIPYGYVNLQIVDGFEVTGINQVKYDLSLEAHFALQVVVPFIASKTGISIDIPLATVLIPGKVPDTYLTIPYLER